MVEDADRPNIVIFTSHDTGAEYSCYGSPIETPSVDALAEEGVRFSNSFCTAPQCSPSRGSILTGLLPHQHGLMGLVNYGWNLPEKNITLPDLAKKAGYSTHLIGLQHEHQDARALGYDHVSDRMDFPYLSDFVIPKAEEFFENMSNQKRPFFASIGVFEGHRPFAHLDEEDTLVSLPDYLPGHPAIKRDYTRFAKGVQKVDAAVRRVRHSLEEAGLKENTLFIFTIDHGPAFPRVKCTAYDPGIRTALIAAWPDRFPGGRVVNELVSNVDLFPTLAQLLGQSVPKSIVGRSLLHMLEADQESRPGSERVFAELSHHDIGYNPFRAIRTKRFKYIRNFAPLPVQFEIPEDIRESESATGFLEVYGRDTYGSERAPEEFYDLAEDPLEYTNLAKEPSYADKKKELRSILLQMLEDTNDPVLDGKIQAPERPGFLVY